MSENQSPPPAPDPAPSVPAEYQPDSAPLQSIERREVLSLVSPHPVHVAEPSDIPVLKNQMDPAFNCTDAHTHRPEQAKVVQGDNLEGSHNRTAPSFAFQQLRQQPGGPPPPSDNHNESPSSTIDPTLQETTPSMAARNGNVSDARGSNDASHANGILLNTVVVDAANANAKPHPYPLPNNLPSNVDLQALLTKLSPGLPKPPESPKIPQTVQTVLPAAPPAHSPPQARAPSLPAPPQTAAGPLPAVQAHHQTTHPLPPPPATSAVVTAVAGPPAGYPASLPPPPNFNQHRQPPPSVPADGEDNDEDSRPFTAEEEDAYNRFLTDERDYVTQGQWDRFPPGSRLFIGNLPTEKVTKRDIFRIFHKHGRLAQVSIKQAYGFVQFLDTVSCASSLRHEQGASVRGRKMHLEVSKPQRNTRPPPQDSNNQRGPNRRSRSPDYGRAMSPRGRGDQGFRGAPRDGSDRAFIRGGSRDHDTYGGRNRSPPARYRARDDYRPHHGRERTRSPPGRYRPRSRSPPPADDLPLPRRAPNEVPEVQALVSDELDRNFIWWVEKAFRERGMSFDMLYLNPRLPLASVVRRQILEGVQAVVFLNRQMQQESKISIQVFDRRGHGEAKFDQYDGLEPAIAAELVARAKAAHAPPPPQPIQTYGQYTAPPPQPSQHHPQQPMHHPQPPIQQQQQQQPHTHQQQQAGVPNLANVLGSLDAGTLQKLLSGLQNQQPQSQQPQPLQQHMLHQPQVSQQPQLTPDLAALLGQRPLQPQPSGNPYGASPTYPQNAAGLAAFLGGGRNQQSPPVPQHHHQQGPPQGGGQMQNIMETLAKWKQT